MIKLKQLCLLLSFAIVLIITGCATDDISTSETDNNNIQLEERQSDNSIQQDDNIEDEIEKEENEQEDEVESGSNEDEKKSADTQSVDDSVKDKKDTAAKQEKSKAVTKQTDEKSAISSNSSKEKPQTEKPKQEKSKKDTAKKDKPIKDKPIKDKPIKDKPKEEKPVEKKKTTVTVSIKVPSGVTGPSYGPKDIEFNAGDSVYDVLMKTGLDVDASGNGARTYVRGISGLKEFAEGPMSGWKYKVDGLFPGESAGSFIVENGQRVEWVYTIDWSEE